MLASTSRPSTQELYEAAKAVRENAYAEYSKFKVGCALLAEDGKVITVANVENVVNGASVCAERGAVSAFLSAGYRRIVEVMVVSQCDPPAPPCGVCRQVLSEFALPTTPIHFGNIHGKIETMTLEELLPKMYTPDHMLKY